MSKSYKVQVVIDDRFYRAIKRIADRRATSVAAVLRELALNSARRREDMEDDLNDDGQGPDSSYGR